MVLLLVAFQRNLSKIVCENEKIRVMVFHRGLLSSYEDVGLNYHGIFHLHIIWCAEMYVQ